MNQLLNSAIIILILVACGLLLFIRISLRRRVLDDDIIPKDWMNEDEIFKFVKNSINDMLRTNIYDLGLSRDEFERQNNKRKAAENITQRLYAWRHKFQKICDCLYC